MKLTMDLAIDLTRTRYLQEQQLVSGTGDTDTLGTLNQRLNGTLFFFRVHRSVTHSHIENKGFRKSLERPPTMAAAKEVRAKESVKAKKHHTLVLHGVLHSALFFLVSVSGERCCWGATMGSKESNRGGSKAKNERSRV